MPASAELGTAEPGGSGPDTLRDTPSVRARLARYKAVTKRYVYPRLNADDRVAPASAPTTRAESAVMRERPSAPIR